MDEKSEKSAGERVTGTGETVAENRSKQQESERMAEWTVKAEAGEELSEGERATLGWRPREEWQGKRWEKGEAILGRYVVEGELGQGGMGVVYACRDTVGGVKVAVKALPPELSHNSVEMEEVRENFELVFKLSHPNIASVKTLERDERGEYFLVMEVAEGVSLRRWLREKWKAGGVSPAEAVGVLRQVAGALDYAHGEKVVHRDVKPGNVMIDARGRVKVLDFGLAAQIRTSLSRASQAYRGTSGTGPYMAPEQWEGQPQGGAADQYALGVVAYEMLAGRLPFENAELAVLKDAVLHGEPRAIPGLGKRVMGALRKAMAKREQERFGSCGEFVEALAGEGGRQCARGKTWTVWVALLALALAAGWGAWAWRGRGGEQTESVEHFEPIDSGKPPDAVSQARPEALPPEAEAEREAESTDGPPALPGEPERLTATKEVPPPEIGNEEAEKPKEEATGGLLEKPATIVAGSGVYVIQAGDSLSKVAAKLGVDRNDLMEVNGIRDPNKIRIGQVLHLPVESVQSGIKTPLNWREVAVLGPGGEEAWVKTRVTIPARGCQMLSIPYANPGREDGLFRFGETSVAGELPKGCHVYFWSGTEWAGGGKTAKGWADVQANHVLAAGEGFFVKNPGKEAITVTVSGLLPTNASSCRRYAGNNELSSLAYPYPVDIPFGDTELARQLPKGATVHFWDAAGQTWVPGTKGAKGWAKTQAQHVLQRGTGFLVQTGSEGVWTEERPYEWP